MSEELYGAAHRALSAVARALQRRRRAEGVAEVIDRLDQQDASPAAFQAPRPNNRPAACRHLPQTVAAAIMVDSSLAAAIAALEDGLDWRQTQGYSDAVLGPGFMDNYAHAEIIGPDGCFAGDDFRLGLLLLGPGLHYRDHYHPAPELYWPLTGPSEWKRGDDGFVTRQAGETIWHRPHVIHATRTGAVPLLAMYAWTRDTGEPAKLVGR